MFDIGALELLMIVIVAVLVIGPKDMPAAMRTAGRWIGQVRKVSAHFRTGVDAMVREAELEDMEKKWKARNEEIMRQNPPPPVAAPNAESAALPDGRDDSAASTMTGPLPSEDAGGNAPLDVAGPADSVSDASDAKASDASAKEA